MSSMSLSWMMKMMKLTKLLKSNGLYENDENGENDANHHYSQSIRELFHYGLILNGAYELNW
jgi:hypothetical protein